MNEPQEVNKQRNELKVVLGNTEFVLEPTFENIQNIESNLGRSFLKISMEVKQGSPNFTLAEVASIIYMAQKEPKKTYAQVGNLLAKHGMIKALKTVADFMSVALQGAQEVDDLGNQPAGANQ